MGTDSQAEHDGRSPSRLLEELDPPFPMLILERGLRIRWVSRAAIEELGIQGERLIGRSWYELFPESADRREQHDELFRGLRSSLDLPRMPLRLGCASPRYFSLRLRPIKSAAGDVEALLGVGEDVTAQVDAAQTLRDSEHRLEVALWSSKAAYWAIDVAHDRATMSPQFFELTGISEPDWHATAHPWNTRMHPDDRPRMRRIYEDYVTGKIDFYECEYRLQTPHGWLWLHDRGRIVERDSDGRALSIAGTTQDASARKNLEQALAESVDRERRRISYDIHDGLGQELSGIQYLLASVANRMRLRNDPDHPHVERALAHLRRTIGSARLIAHGLASAGVGPGGLGTALTTLAEEVADAHGISVSCEIVDWDGTELSEATAQELFRIVQEALNNACRHGKATEVVVALRRAGRSLKLDVADNGRGIRLPLPDTAGIGLKIMAHRAQTVGATFAIEPRSTGGTRITLTCPLADAPPSVS